MTDRPPRSVTRRRRRRRYDVVVGRGMLGELPAHARRTRPQGARSSTRRRCARPGRRARASDLLAERYEVLIAEIPDAEEGKRVEVAAFCWQVLGQTDFTRTDAVVGFGGGAVTDLAGFVAATGCAGSRSCRCRRPCSAWSTRPSAARPASTPPRARTSSARSTRPRACSATSTRCDDAAAQRAASPASPRSSRPASSPTRRSSTSSRRDPRPSIDPTGAEFRAS